MNRTSGTLVMEMKQRVQRKKKINHGLPLCQNNMNGVYLGIVILPLPSANFTNLSGISFVLDKIKCLIA
jgi:hypothetical protein